MISIVNCVAVRIVVLVRHAVEAAIVAIVVVIIAVSSLDGSINPIVIHIVVLTVTAVNANHF